VECEVLDCVLGFNGLPQTVTASVSIVIILLVMVVFICSKERSS